ncbi:hypothetical protein P154DRAFT_339358 [Amniculicola lignicola CBS 123094]|uniref:Uncharacterized protein n=1 Tax=Amniculicola lignicola CBS 123094 TaxID=1392246 RepID=A0A6A5WX09_9PLEO|nr:hypothetical protein P154DRAFT_339358 [Amniculicola lignicola CBS 123094]
MSLESINEPQILARNRTRFRFLDLPREVRDMVYDFSFQELPGRIRLQLKTNDSALRGDCIKYSLSYGDTPSATPFHDLETREKCMRHPRWVFLNHQVFLEAREQFYRRARCVSFTGRGNCRLRAQKEALTFFLLDRVRILDYTDHDYTIDIVLRPLPEDKIAIITSTSSIKSRFTDIFRYLDAYGSSMKFFRICVNPVIYEIDKDTFRRFTFLDETPLRYMEPIFDIVEISILQPRIRPIENAWIVCNAFERIQEELLDMALGLIRDPVSTPGESPGWTCKVKDRVFKIGSGSWAEFEWRLEVQKGCGGGDDDRIVNKKLPGFSEIFRDHRTVGWQLRTFERIWGNDNGLGVYRCEEGGRVQIAGSQVKKIGGS